MKYTIRVCDRETGKSLHDHILCKGVEASSPASAIKTVLEKFNPMVADRVYAELEQESNVLAERLVGMWPDLKAFLEAVADGDDKDEAADAQHFLDTVTGLGQQPQKKAPIPCGYCGEIGTHALGYCPIRAADAQYCPDDKDEDYPDDQDSTLEP